MLGYQAIIQQLRSRPRWSPREVTSCKGREYSYLVKPTPLHYYLHSQDIGFRIQHRQHVAYIARCTFYTIYASTLVERFKKIFNIRGLDTVDSLVHMHIIHKLIQ